MPSLRVRALEAAVLAGVLATVAAVAYLPHADTFTHPPAEGAPALARLVEAYAARFGGGVDDYEYPVHVDEHAHWVAMSAIQRVDSLRYGDPYAGLERSEFPLSLRGLVHERGFHVAVVMFQEMTGIPWVHVIRFLPAVWLASTALVVWAALRPWAGALPAAGLVALVPTSARFLGPGFLVPIGFGLAWVAVVLLLAPSAVRRGPIAGLLLLLTVWAFFIHLIAGFAALLTLVASLPFLRGSRGGLTVMAGVAIAPVAWLSESFQSDVTYEVTKSNTLPIDFTVFDQLGVPFLALWVVGCGLAAIRPPRTAAPAVLAGTVGSMVMFALIVVALAADLRLYALYERWHQPFALLAALPVAHALVSLAGAGAALAFGAAARMRRGVPRARQRHAVAAVALGLAFVGATEAGVQQHLREPYYHVLDDADWASYTWAAANVGPGREVFLSHPWKGVVFTAMTGKQPYTYLLPGTPPVRGDDYGEYVAGRFSNGAWLVEREISLVVDPVIPGTSDFEAVGPGTAVLAEPYASELRAIRAAR